MKLKRLTVSGPARGVEYLTPFLFVTSLIACDLEYLTPIRIRFRKVHTEVRWECYVRTRLLTRKNLG